MKLKLGAKINLMFLSIILLFSVIIGFLVNDKVRDGIKDFAVEKAKSDLNLAYRFVDTKYKGDWAIKDGQLYKGHTLVNNNFDLVDEIGADTGGTITIFQQDKRVTTNVEQDGQRAVGTKVSKEVSDKVLGNHETYFGEANVAGNMYQAAYRPLMDKDGKVVGIFYVGAGQSIIDHIVSKMIKTIFIVLVCIVVFAIIVIAMFTKRIRTRLLNITKVLKAAGDGDFTKKLFDRSSDELAEVAESYNQMAENMKVLIKDVNEHSSHVQMASNELAHTADDTMKMTTNVTSSVGAIVQNVKQQQQMITQSVSAVNEMTQGIGQVSENAFNVAEASTQSTHKAENGQKSVQNVVKQIRSIYDANEQTSAVMKQLEERSHEIGNITAAITSIADQTNLLALNAAIEAARAGEHGKGFAIVADEVRKLSEQSNHSASLIASIVKAIQEDTKHVVALMMHTHDEIEDGIVLVRETGETFDHIVNSIAIANTGIQELSAISEQMSASMQEINASIENISHLATVTSDDAQKISKVTTDQLNLTNYMKEAVGTMTVKSDDLSTVITRFNI